jgi:hypothetical protein
MRWMLKPGRSREQSRFQIFRPQRPQFGLFSGVHALLILALREQFDSASGPFVPLEAVLDVLAEALYQVVHATIFAHN